MLNFFKLLGDEGGDDEAPPDPRAPRSGSDDPHAPRVAADDPHAPRHGAQDPYAARDDRGEPLQRVADVGVRYIVNDVDEAIRFYTTHLGFALDHDASPAFATVSRDGVRLMLSGDGSSGKRALPDGRRQEPGGWNRIHLRTADLVADVRRLRAAGVPFRTPELVTGPGGAQMIIEDPSGNPIELFQPLR
jgi:catechol 2,3-dioxygenase-like lactoylglutathione lyase family enzyme